MNNNLHTNNENIPNNPMYMSRRQPHMDLNPTINNNRQYMASTPLSTSTRDNICETLSSMNPISNDTRYNKDKDYTLVERTESESFLNEERSRRPARKQRTVFTRHQLKRLMEVYAVKKYLPSEERRVLGLEIKCTSDQIKVWFQNHRSKDKRLGRTHNSTVVNDLNSYDNNKQHISQLNTNYQVFLS